MSTPTLSMKHQFYKTYSSFWKVPVKIQPQYIKFEKYDFTSEFVGDMYMLLITNPVLKSIERFIDYNKNYIKQIEDDELELISHRTSMLPLTYQYIPRYLLHEVSFYEIIKTKEYYNFIKTIAEKIYKDDEIIRDEFIDAYINIYPYIFGVVKRVGINYVYFDIDFKGNIPRENKPLLAELLVYFLYHRIHDTLKKYGDIEYYITPSNNIRIIVKFEDDKEDKEFNQKLFYNIAKKDIYKYKTLTMLPYNVPNVNYTKIRKMYKDIFENKILERKFEIKSYILRSLLDLVRDIVNDKEIKCDIICNGENYSRRGFITIDYVNTNEFQYIDNTYTIIKTNYSTTKDFKYKMITIDMSNLENKIKTKFKNTCDMYKFIVRNVNLFSVIGNYIIPVNVKFVNTKHNYRYMVNVNFNLLTRKISNRYRVLRVLNLSELPYIINVN